MVKYRIEMDLHNDFERILLNRMKQLGVESSSTGSNLIIEYLTTMRKHIVPNPRRVLLSKEFVCPVEYNIGLERIIDKIKAGDDLSLYLSKYILSPKYNDKLINDWGIHHLHLGDTIENNRYKRTDALLFAHFTDDIAYLINIFYHGDWTEQKVMQIIIDNWSHLLNPINGVTPTSISKQEHAKIRKNNGNVTPDFGDNVAYMPLGGGMMMNGNNFQDLLEMDNVQHEIQQIDKYIRENIDEIADQYRLRTNLNLPTNLSFELKLEDISGGFSAFEPSIKLQINIS